VDGMVERITKEMHTTPKVLATGGLAMLIAGVSKTIEKTEQSLTLDGLKIISNFIEKG
jgi:type III pantothenate kinase